MLALNFDPITTELILKRVDSPTVTITGAQATSYTLTGTFTLKNGLLVVDDSVSIEEESVFTILDDSTLEIV